MINARAALYLDFDNVFSSLLKVDPDAAMKFAENPGSWLQTLSTELLVAGPRRWVVARCYLNPSGSVANPKKDVEPTRLYFSRFRQDFVQAGFEVIDCPRLTLTKNAADIRLVVDAMEALQAPTRYDEFVILSGDSDMTPLLYRLRGDDRRTTIISPSDAAEVLSSIADRFIDSRALIDVIAGGPIEDDDLAELAPQGETATSADVPSPANDMHSIDDDQCTPIDVIDPAASMRRWDETAPEVVKRAAQVLGLPRLPSEYWSPLYETLAEFGRAYPFNLTEITRWSRDRLVGQGFRIGRTAAAFVVRGVAFGGAPLYRTPTPDRAELAQAFFDNIADRLSHAGVEMTEEDSNQLRDWLIPRTVA